jgi:hypothetical protein
MPNAWLKPAIAAMAICALATPSLTRAGGPVALTAAQLDRVTAGGANVGSSSTATAAGVFTLTETTGTSLVVGGASPSQQPGLSSTAAASDGTALAVGTNLGSSGASPPASTTSVVTSGTADGNLVISSTVNHTTQGVGGVTFQAGWTFVYGTWFGL